MASQTELKDPPRSGEHYFCYEQVRVYVWMRIILLLMVSSYATDGGSKSKKHQNEPTNAEKKTANKKTMHDA